MTTTAAATINVRVIRYDDLLTRTGRKIRNLPLEDGVTLAEAVALVWFGDVGRRYDVAEHVTALKNGEAADLGILGGGFALRDGDELQLAPRVGESGTIVMAAIAIISAVLSAVLASNIALPSARGSETNEERRFGFSRISNGAFAGGPIQVVMGRRVRYGGQVVARIPIENETGDLDTALRVLLCLGHGVIGEIAGQASDFDAMSPADLDGVFLDDQPAERAPGVKVWGRMGSTGQGIIPGFDDVEVPREVGGGSGVNLVNTSGSEITGPSPGGESYVFTTINEVNAVRIRVRLPRGLYTAGATGQVDTARVKWRARTRTADVGSGPGSWSDFSQVDIIRAEQSEFISSLRLDGFNGGVAAKMDIQVERVSKDSTNLRTQDLLVWDSIVELTYADQTYDGFAVVGLYIPASEEITSEPRISLAVNGIKVRVWDGVSSPTAPEFVVQWSNNPAWLALELLTNRTWGMGSTYTDEHIDFSTLFEWAEYCDELVPRASGGTRKRFTCNLVLNEQRSGVEWLRTICQAGRAVPVTSGNLWRFICDKPQATPVEIFTDGSVAVSEDGEAEFEVVYEHTTGGLAVPNQISLQFENEGVQGLPDAIVWPQPGELWLGDPLNEPVRGMSVRLEGVTDPEQALAEVVYLLKRQRGLSKSLAFTTTKPYIVTQPGDRFDMAMSLPGWGLASGRLELGSTASSLKLDRTVTLEEGVTYYVKVIHLDGTVEERAITNAPGTYAAGEAITIASALAQAPGSFAEYAVGQAGVVVKPWRCTSISPSFVDVETAEGPRSSLRWTIGAKEYSDELYGPGDFEVNFPDYSTLDSIFTPPGPVIGLKAFQRSDGARVQVQLVWSQLPADRARTSTFRAYWRGVGTSAWVKFPSPSVGARSVVSDIIDVNRGYEFTVVAVSFAGYAMSPYDPRNPIVSLAFGLGEPPLPPPATLTISQQSGNTYRLDWDAVDDAVGYQVLFAGRESTRPNGGAENCLVLARTNDTFLSGLELAPGQSHTFYVRSINGAGRLSWAATSATIGLPSSPAGESIKQTAVFDLDGTGSSVNLVFDSGDNVFKLDDPDLEGVWTSDTIDSGTLTLTELTLRPVTVNDASDEPMEDLDFLLPSIEADQWGVATTSPIVVGMLMPPYSTEHGDDAQSWVFEVRTHNGTTWSSWQALSPGDAIRRVFREYEVRVRMRRAAFPYRPALAGLVAVLTN